MRQTNRILAAVATVALALLATNAAQAAVVDLHALSIDNISGTISTSSSTQSFDQTLSSPAQLDMGIYAGTLVNVNFTVSGYPDPLTATLNSSATYSPTPPSGTVDTSAGTISLDLSSLFLTVTDNTTGLNIAEGPIWSPSSPTSPNSYDPGTGAFTYSWSDSMNVDGTTVTYAPTMTGYATVVPLPATAPLMLGGLLLLGWYGLRRKRA